MQLDVQNKKFQGSREDLIIFFFHLFLLCGTPIIEVKDKKKR